MGAVGDGRTALRRRLAGAGRALLGPLADLHRRLRRRRLVITDGPARGMCVEVARSEPGGAPGAGADDGREWAGLTNAGDVVYDVGAGAGAGVFSLIAARRSGPSGRVYAFEADPGRAELVCRNAARNRQGNVTVVGGTVTTGTAGVGRHDDVTATTVALGDFARRRGVAPPDVMRIDVGGALLDVFHGMTSLLQGAVPTMMVVVRGESNRATELQQRRAAAFLSEFGYQVQPLGGDGAGGAGTSVTLLARNERRAGLLRQRVLPPLRHASPVGPRRSWA